MTTQNQETQDPSQSELSQLRALFKSGRYRELENRANMVLHKYPHSGLVWELCGLSLQMQGKNPIRAFTRTAELLPDDPGVHYNLGFVLKSIGRLDDAAASYQKALALKPDYLDALVNLGNILKDQGHFDKAKESYVKALDIDKDCPGALIGLSHIHAIDGDEKASEDVLARVLQHKPNDLEARFLLAMTRKAWIGDENLGKLTDLEKACQSGHVQLPDREATLLHFALGKCLDDVGEFDRAFPHFMLGAKLKRATFEYDADQMTRHFNEVIRIFDQDRIEQLCGAGNGSGMPIFVLGMPRSGTTLVEQILASHPEVYGAGELLELLNIIQRDVSGISGYPGNVPGLDRSILTQWADDYVDALHQYNRDARYITDKKPDNFWAIGLIHAMLPNAKIVHVNRNPVDTCLSCFTKLFSGSMQYTYDLRELGRYYVDYARLMEHWRTVLPAGAFLDVQYEEVTADLESQVRRILDYCGLEWNDTCIQFHKHKRSIGTASMAQARLPIYKSSVERWRSYEKHLATLLEALGDLAPRTT